MFDVSERFDNYSDLLQDRIQTCVFFLIVFLVVLLGITLLLVKSAKEDEKLNDPDEEKQKAKKEKREIVFISVLIFIFAICGLIQTLHDLIDCVYDKKHNAYVVVDGVFTVEKEEYGIGRLANDPVYTLFYEQDGQMVEVDIITKYCDLPEGEYTDTVLVFSSRSKVLLEVIEKS